MNSTTASALSPQDRAKLSARTAIALSTISRWEKGEIIRDSTRIALERAARQMRMMVPEAAQKEAKRGQAKDGR